MAGKGSGRDPCFQSPVLTGMPLMVLLHWLPQNLKKNKVLQNVFMKANNLM